MWGERFPWQYRLIRLLNWIILGAERWREAPQRTRDERLRAQYGPSRRETCLVVLIWLIVVLLLVHLVVRVR